MTSLLGNMPLGDLGPEVEDLVHDILCTHFSGVGLFDGGWTVEDGGDGVLVWVERTGHATWVALEAPAFSGLRQADRLLAVIQDRTGRSAVDGGITLHLAGDGTFSVSLAESVTAHPLDPAAVVAAVARLLEDVHTVKALAAA
ncbi:hypothetical protein [Nocardioides sp. GY 10127]|uniref:hypothetical protein n=1 Tax=Nocardioides sp. GY 10127 TaxID=2569762 RepID=UPI0010A8A2C2|nr:hypothetical protein [Nocardioides sp. GY 10127]TIC82933.1 hypothetical protein E8D37_09805 [Nocardioides sp. GY 10127]